jgi:hypothetical protein
MNIPKDQSPSEPRIVKLSLGEFRKLTDGMPDETPITYNAYDKGCCLSNYTTSDVWLFPKDKQPKKAIVINPATDYDYRQSRKIL